MDTNLHTDELQHYGINFDATIGSEELQHWGIKGMKWGQRRYQNRDGTLTPAGQKRYNKEAAALKKEQDKLKAEKKVLANQKKSQSKFDKLEEKRQKLEADKKALADEKKRFKSGEKEKPEPTKSETEALREKLLKSTDAKELYKNRDLLEYAEIKERIDRIDMEAKLHGKIPVENKSTIQDRIDKAVSMYKTVDNAYSTVTNSAIGKTLAKQLGIKLPEKETPEFDVRDFVKNINKKSAKEVQEVAQRLANEKRISDELDRRDAKQCKAEADLEAKKAAERKKTEGEQRKAEAQKQVDAYNKKWQEGKADSTYRKSGRDVKQDDLSDGKKYEVAVTNAGRTAVSNIVSSNRSNYSNYSSRGRSYTNSSKILDGTIRYDSDGTMRVSYEPEDD